MITTDDKKKTNTIVSDTPRIMKPGNDSVAKKKNIISIIITAHTHTSPRK